MSERIAESSGVALPEDAGGNAYQMSMAGMALPLPIHWAFNAIAGLSLLLLGHPAAAMASFAGCSALAVRRWSPTPSTRPGCAPAPRRSKVTSTA